MLKQGSLLDIKPRIIGILSINLMLTSCFDGVCLYSAHWKPRHTKVEKIYFPKYCDSGGGKDGSGGGSAQYGRIHHQKLKCFPKKIILGPPPTPKGGPVLGVPELLLEDSKKSVFFARIYLFLMGNIFGKINFLESSNSSSGTPSTGPP